MISACLKASIVALAAANFDVPLTKEHYFASSRHASTSQAIDLSPLGNIAYSGPVYIGTPEQGTSSSKFIYDSGSGYLLVTSNNCASCTTQFYNQTASSTATTSTLTQ
jgi:hypothetical protein